MTPKAKRTLFLVAALSVSGSALAVIASGNMGKNLVYYWSPTEVHTAGPKAVGATVRLGGLVKAGTVDWRSELNELHFIVTDGANEVPVHATHAPPQMFREGIGVVVEGTMTQAGVFETERLMVKHSNEYKAPGTMATADGGGAPADGATPTIDVADLYKTVEEQ
jgi:cytochrome c-type biogenesis protein CcmE